MTNILTQTLGKLIDKITASRTTATDGNRELALNLSIKVMSLVSVADGKVDDDEVKLVQDVYRDRVGSLIDPATIKKAFYIVVADKDSLLEELRAAHDLDGQLRRDIFTAAVEIAAVDKDLRDEEFDLLRRIGAALALPVSLIDEQLAEAKTR